MDRPSRSIPIAHVADARRPPKIHKCSEIRDEDVNKRRIPFGSVGARELDPEWAKIE